MKSTRPPVAILMAVYEPRIDWLREQLTSLNAQTYPNLRLYLRDDGSRAALFEEITACVRACIRAFPYVIRRNKRNVGSNLTFARLTREAEGTYFAYCDQDDVWLPDKLEILQSALAQSGARLACSDMYVIDEHGRQLADSITKLRKRQKLRSGAGLTEGLLVSNFVTGCTMLIRAETAKAALPFCPYMVHDHYLALHCAAGGGAIHAVPKPLIRYRIHGGNQTGVMAGVVDKKSYGEMRIDIPLQKFYWLKRYFPYRVEWAGAIEERLQWMEARQRYWHGRGGAATIWKYRGFGFLSVAFEWIARWLPEAAFRQTIYWIRRM